QRVKARGHTGSRRDPRPTPLSSQRAGGRPGEGPRRRGDAPGAPAPARRANAARTRHARAGSRGMRQGGKHHRNATRDAGSGLRAPRRRSPAGRGHGTCGCDRPCPSGRARAGRSPRGDGRLPARSPGVPRRARGGSQAPRSRPFARRRCERARPQGDQRLRPSVRGPGRGDARRRAGGRARAGGRRRPPARPRRGPARGLRGDARMPLITYSPKVFIPLTKLCRDVCHYCTFAQPPRRGERAYMRAAEVREVARAGAEAGCHEALFTLGDKPERRYRAARKELAELGCETTIEYLAGMCELVAAETGLLPHVNPGVMTRDELALLRTVSASQGIMLETAAARLSQKGMPHYGSPDKLPERRLETIGLAGELAIPFTTGILIGIGETRDERLEALAGGRLLARGAR